MFRIIFKIIVIKAVVKAKYDALSEMFVVLNRSNTVFIEFQNMATAVVKIKAPIMRDEICSSCWWP